MITILMAFNITLGANMLYIDDRGFYHDKKSASSNNKYIYSAYAKKVGLLPELTPVMQQELDFCYANKVRHSMKQTSVMSRDEIVGMAYLDKNTANKIIEEGFNFSPYKIPSFNLFKLIKQVLEVRGKHRNYFWQNNLDQIYRFAFSLPLQDRAFVYRSAGRKVPLIYVMIEDIDKSLNSSNRSSRAIRSLKYDNDNDQGIYDYFSDDHPIRVHMDLTRNK